jgi:DNA-binding FrmR family transcriptional regulator
MNPDTILQKTDKGLQEIETRQHKLSGRLRAVLFMIDGQRPTAQLLEQAGSLADQLEGQLQELLNQGFIAGQVNEPEPVIEAVVPAPAEPVREEPRKAAAAPAAPAKLPPSKPEPAIRAEPPVRPVVPLDVLKARLAKMVNDSLGMRAVFHAQQISAVSNHAQLETVIDEMARGLATSMGAQAATRWRADARATVGLGN